MQGLLKNRLKERQSRRKKMKTLLLILINMMISTLILGSSFILPPKTVSTYNSIEDILKTIDPAILPKFPYEQQFAKDTGTNANVNFIVVLNQKAQEIRNYISAKYGEDFGNLPSINVIILGIAMVPFEQRDMLTGRVSYEQAFGCMMTALSGATGISALVSAWNSGATASTILSTLKSILKVSYGWFAVGYAVYQFGDCVGWW